MHSIEVTERFSLPRADPCFVIWMLRAANWLYYIDIFLNIMVTFGKSSRTHLVPVVHIGMRTFFSCAPLETVWKAIHCKETVLNPSIAPEVATHPWKLEGRKLDNSLCEILANVHVHYFNDQSSRVQNLAMKPAWNLVISENLWPLECTRSCFQAITAKFMGGKSPAENMIFFF